MQSTPTPTGGYKRAAEDSLTSDTKTKASKLDGSSNTHCAFDQLVDDVVIEIFKLVGKMSFSLEKCRSGYESILNVSRRCYTLAYKLKKVWVENNCISPYIYGCTTPEESVLYIKEHNTPKAHLSQLTYNYLFYSLATTDRPKFFNYFKNLNDSHLKILENVPSLQELRVEYAAITKFNFDRFSALTSLTLRANQISELSVTAPLTNLERFAIGSRDEKIGDALVNVLNYTPNLRHLEFHENSLSPQLLEQVEQLIGLESLECKKVLYRDGKNNTANGQSFNFNFIKFYRLKTLSLNSDCARFSLTPSESLSTLTTLSLRCHGLTLTLLQYTPNLTDLTLGDKFNDPYPIYQLKNLTNLSLINLYNNETLKLDFTQLPPLRTLSLKGFAKFKCVPFPMPTLHTLHLTNEKSGEKLTGLFESVPNLTCLKLKTKWNDELKTYALINTLTKLENLLLLADTIPGTNITNLINLKKLTVIAQTLQSYSKEFEIGTFFDHLPSLINLECLKIINYDIEERLKVDKEEFNNSIRDLTHLKEIVLHEVDFIKSEDRYEDQYENLENEYLSENFELNHFLQHQDPDLKYYTRKNRQEPDDMEQ